MGPVLGKFDFDLSGHTAACYSVVVLMLCFVIARHLVNPPFGGTGWLYGGVAGAIVFKLMQDVISSITPQYWTFWIGLFLVALVVSQHQGLGGKWWQALGANPAVVER